MSNFKFNEHGLVDMGDGDESTTIFQKSEMGTAMQDRPDARGAGTAKAMGLAAQLHANTHEGTNGEPDWVGLLMQAKTERAKWTIRAARDSWKEEQRYKAVASQMAEQDAHIEEVIRRPNRNKAFYDDLRINDPRTYYSVPCQRQMRNDKSSMGLGYHLKSKK